MDTDNEIRQLVLKNASTDQIREAAQRGGMRTLAEDGWRLVRLGVTTVEEVLSVTTAKEVARTTQDEAPDAWPEQLPATLAIGEVNLMPTFQYKALQANGAIAEGQLEAAAARKPFARWKRWACARSALPKSGGATAKDGSSNGGDASGLAGETSPLSSNRRKSPPRTWRISRGCSPVCWRRACR